MSCTTQINAALSERTSAELDFSLRQELDQVLCLYILHVVQPFLLMPPPYLQELSACSHHQF